jgi:serine/threonine protein phosphatase PrpC
MKITHKFGEVTNILDNNNPFQTAGSNSNYCLFGVFDGHGGSKCS